MLPSCWWSATCLPGCSRRRPLSTPRCHGHAPSWRLARGRWIHFRPLISPRRWTRQDWRAAWRRSGSSSLRGWDPWRTSPSPPRCWSRRRMLMRVWTTARMAATTRWITVAWITVHDEMDHGQDSPEPDEHAHDAHDDMQTHSAEDDHGGGDEHAGMDPDMSGMDHDHGAEQTGDGPWRHGPRCDGPRHVGHGPQRDGARHVRRVHVDGLHDEGSPAQPGRIADGVGRGAFWPPVPGTPGRARPDADARWRHRRQRRAQDGRHPPGHHRDASRTGGVVPRPPRRARPLRPGELPPPRDAGAGRGGGFCPGRDGVARRITPGASGQPPRLARRVHGPAWVGPAA